MSKLIQLDLFTVLFNEELDGAALRREKKNARGRGYKARKRAARIAANPEAPWGYRKDGKPKSEPGSGNRRHPNEESRQAARERRKELDRVYMREIRAGRTPEQIERDREIGRINNRKRWHTKTPEEKAKANADSRKWALRHPEKRKQISKKSYYKDVEKTRAGKRLTARKWNAENPDYGREYHKRCPEQRKSAKARRRALELKASPRWIRPKDFRPIFAECLRLSRETGDRHEVDHIVPLKNRTVCGLHVVWNLQILTRKENREKSNRFIESLAVAPTRANGLLKDQ